MTLEELSDLYEVAARLERARDFASARDAFLVVGDAAEESGIMDGARDARRRSMINHVVAWARERWPADDLHIHDVHFSQFPFGIFGGRGRRSRVDLQVRRRNQYPNTWTHVTVGRRGDIRIEHDPHREW